jgi:hypothetical protein
MRLKSKAYLLWTLFNKISPAVGKNGQEIKAAITMPPRRKL